jgi:hypothetical protein
MEDERVGHVARMGEMRNVIKGRGHLGDLVMDGRIILKCILRK